MNWRRMPCQLPNSRRRKAHCEVHLLRVSFIGSRETTIDNTRRLEYSNFTLEYSNPALCRLSGKH